MHVYVVVRKRWEKDASFPQFSNYYVFLSHCPTYITPPPLLWRYSSVTITVVRQLSTYLHVHGIIYFSLPPQSTLNSWCLPLLKQCEDYLSAIVHKHKDPAPSEAGQAGYSLNEQAEHEAIRYLFTLGEVAHVSNVHAEYVFDIYMYLHIHNYLIVD